MSSAARQSGFSLLELSVALAVLALAVVALLHLGSQSTRSAQASERHALALMLAQNLAVSASLDNQHADSGQTELGPYHWQWQRETVPASLPGLQGWQWRISAEDGQQVAELTSWQVAR